MLSHFDKFQCDQRGSVVKLLRSFDQFPSDSECAEVPAGGLVNEALCWGGEELQLSNKTPPIIPSSHHFQIYSARLHFSSSFSGTGCQLLTANVGKMKSDSHGNRFSKTNKLLSKVQPAKR